MSSFVLAWQQQAIIHHTQRLLHSFEHWTGRSLLDVGGSPMEAAQALFCCAICLSLSRYPTRSDF